MNRIEIWAGLSLCGTGFVIPSYAYLILQFYWSTIINMVTIAETEQFQKQVNQFLTEDEKDEMLTTLHHQTLYSSNMPINGLKKHDQF
jgi:hypothetical protein